MAEKEGAARIAVLNDALEQIRVILARKNNEEADYREGLCWLKFAHQAAEPFLLGDEHAEIRERVQDKLTDLLKLVKLINPSLVDWDKARDPSFPIMARSTRSGSRQARAFDPGRVAQAFENERDKIVRIIAPELLEGSGEEETSDPLGLAVETGGLVIGGPTAGNFLLSSSGDDRSRRRTKFPRTPRRVPSDYDTETDRSSKRPPRRERKKDKSDKYGHNENDFAFFNKKYNAVTDALNKLDLGEDLQYPSNESFRLFFTYFDFQKAMKNGSLQKFDGTVRGYPSFKTSFHDLVFVQREHYLPKLMALEYMVPDHIKRELFHGLHNSVKDFGFRILRLEEKYGGEERQLQYLMKILGKAQEKGRLPYKELRELVRDVQAHLQRTDASEGAAKALVVMLKEVVPQHIKAQCTAELRRVHRPRTGNNFISYVAQALDDELQAAETNPRRREEGVSGSKNEKRSKVLGKLYQQELWTAPSGSLEDGDDSVGEGEARVGRGQPEEIPMCVCCQLGKHRLHNCRKFFLLYTLKEKANLIKQHQHCRKCLRPGHQVEGCFFRNRPDCRFCASNGHHYLLCPGPGEGEMRIADRITENTQPDENLVEGLGFENLGETVTRKRISTLQMVAYAEGPNGKKTPLNVLVDSGASHNIIDARAAERLGLKGKPCKYRVTGHGGYTTEHQASKGKMVLINPKREWEKTQLTYYAYENPCGPLMPEDWGRLKKGWPHLKSLELPSPADNQPVEMILGCDNIRLMEAVKPPAMRRLQDPIAKLTSIGWMVGGRTIPESSGEEEDSVQGEEGMAIADGSVEKEVSKSKNKKTAPDTSNQTIFSGYDETDLETKLAECREELSEIRKNLKRVWDLESDEEVRKLKNRHYPAIKSARQLKTEEILRGQMRQREDGRYEAGLLWKDDERPHNNYSAAKKAYLDWENRMEKDTLVSQVFHFAMQNWLKNHYLENIDNCPNMDQNFLTTFVVLKEGQTPDQGRLVVNGARKFGGRCLNDYLEPGANMMNNLGDLLMRLRRYRYAVCCDLASMFLNIKVAKEDRHYLRVFYRANKEEELKVYQFTVHVFGLASSPCVSMTCVRKQAEDKADSWPLAKKAVSESSLVDDIWILSDEKREVEQGIREIQELMDTMKIKVHKWGTNDPGLLKDIPEDRRAKTIWLSEDDRTAIKALGIVWDTESDTFLFPKGPPILQPWTLRTMTSSAGQTFDPSGLLAPSTLPAKLLIQHVWRYQKEWDEEVPANLGKKMSLFCENQKQLKQVEIPRRIGEINGRLIVFTDSSTLAQAAAAYWVSQDGEKIVSRLIGSKVKVTGIRQHEHIGRLELVAAVLGVRLAEKIAKAFQLDMNRIQYFTDSMLVLYCLSTTAGLSAYAGHRVAKIMERSSFKLWKYVHTSENPSDLPTRGLRAADMAHNKLWWEGPGFLTLRPEEWPPQPYIRETAEIAAEKRTLEDLGGNVILTLRDERGGKEFLMENLFRKNQSVTRTIQGLKKLSEMAKHKIPHGEYLTEYRDWEEIWIRKEQREKFGKLIQALENQKKVTELVELNPRIDDHGLVRVSAGLEHSQHHGWDVKYPILMHKSMSLVKEYVKNAHQYQLAHIGGIRTLMNVMRKRFHIIGLRRLATEVVHKCLPCAKRCWVPLKRATPEFHASRMGNNSLRAFEEIGIDHAGPFQIKQGRSQVEAYILVIACCATRAISLEMSLSTGAEHVLAALQRHVGVFGVPKYINCDQAPGFCKAKRLVDEHSTLLRREGWEGNVGPDWKLNVPYSPTWSSHVEAMVKIVKGALKHLHTGPSLSKLTADEFYTQIKRAQGYINMRPLILAGPDQEPLSPGDFIGSGTIHLSNFVFRPEDEGRLGYRYRQLEKVRHDLWGRFREDYITWLKRQGSDVEHLPQIGDLVLVKDVPAWKGDGWPVAKIVSIRAGQDTDNPRVYDLEAVPTEELRKEPRLVNHKMRLQLNKKIISRNYRQLGWLPKVSI